MVKIRKVLKFTNNKLLEEIIENKTEAQTEKPPNKFVQMLSLTSELGFSISLPIAGGALLGNYLDDKFHSNPRLTLSLIFTGLLIGFARIYSIVKETEKENNK